MSDLTVNQQSYNHGLLMGMMMHGANKGKRTVPEGGGGTLAPAFVESLDNASWWWNLNDKVEVKFS